MKVVYNMDELAKRLGVGKITHIIVTDLCLCIECSDAPTKKKVVAEPKQTKQSASPDRLRDFMNKMAGPRF